MMVRPRAWNMAERHLCVRGAAVPGALFDFALHMYHNAAVLQRKGLGPFMYCSKVECYEEALLWDR
jgi:malate synthase